MNLPELAGKCDARSPYAWNHVGEYRHVPCQLSPGHKGTHRFEGLNGSVEWGGNARRNLNELAP